MLESYRLNGMYVGLPPAPGRLSPAVAARRFQLVALLLDGVGGKRPVLGLRWCLPVYEQAQHQPLPGAHHARLDKPFVLRAVVGETVELQVTNLLPHTPLCLALVDDDYGIFDAADGGEMLPGATRTFTWRCRHAGIYPIYNCACLDPVERRNLLGVLIIEPQESGRA